MNFLISQPKHMLWVHKRTFEHPNIIMLKLVGKKIFTNQRAAKTQTSLCKCTVLTELSLLAYTKNNYWQFNYQNFTCDLRKWTPTLHVMFTNKKVTGEVEILNWAQWSQRRKQRTSNFTCGIQLKFSLQWNTIVYIFTAVKCSFFKICIIF